MRLLVILIHLLISCLSPACALASDDPPPASDVRKAIERSLPFIEKEGVAWKEKRKCSSCHHVPFMIWSHNEARAKGIAVDAAKLDSWEDWALGQSLSARAFYKLTTKFVEFLGEDSVPDETLAKLKPLVDKPYMSEEELLAALSKALTPEELQQDKTILLSQAAQKKGGFNDGAGLDSVNQLLLGRGGNSEKVKEYAALMPPLLARWQENDGSWKTAGQFPGQNRPLPESHSVATGWHALAIASAENLSEESKKCLERAATNLKGIKPGKSTESLIIAVLVARKFDTPEKLAAAIADLKKHQNEDGGWGWLIDAPSDAFATGQALYALAYGPADTAVFRAEKYLLSTQGEDGSWAVPTTEIAAPATKPDRLKSLEIIYRFWGTAWATIGLSHTLPDK